MRLKESAWIAALLIVTLPGFAAFAQGQGRGQGKGQEQKEEKKAERKEAKKEQHKGYYSTHDRDAMRAWYRAHESNLPPGLAKRDRLPPGLERQLRVNGTLPPGLQREERPVPPEAGDDHLRLAVGFAVAIGVGIEEDVGGIGDPHAAVADREAAGNVQSVGENRELVRLAVGVGVFEEESRTNGWRAPHVVAHEHLPKRFDRYRLTAGYNQVVNRRQFAAKDLVWPTEYRYPDATYADEFTLRVGELEIFLRHEKGETDDATVTWLPGPRVLATGDLFVWSSPNAGNPQKVQRYPREWAQALRRMAELGAQYLLPGHGVPIIGAARIAQALGDTATYLESLVEQTLALMNEGARLSDVLVSVRPPADLAARPYLQPVYDEPEFIVRSIWRRYGGWWDGNPANLLPASDQCLARELAELAGGASALAARAERLGEDSDDEAQRLAGHLIEVAWRASPHDTAIQEVRQRVFTQRAATATSTMARGIFSWAARESLGPRSPGNEEDQ